MIHTDYYSIIQFDIKYFNYTYIFHLILSHKVNVKDHILFVNVHESK